MRIGYFIFLFLFWFAAGNAYSEDSKCHRSTEGKEFWFGFMEGRNDNGNVHYIEITVTAKESTSFQIFIGKSTTPLPSIPNSVDANGSVQISIPLDLAEAKGSEIIQEKGIHLVAENPVNVYALNWDYNSADVAVIYPVPSLGNEYFTMCYTPNVNIRPAHGRNSEFLIVASEDNTNVNITPSVVTDGGKAAGISYPITLNKGEVYQVQSLNQRNLPGQGDLTGSYIESDKPVAVYSGNLSTTIPSESDMAGFDHLYEQMPPLQTWGREFYAVPLLTRQADRYRIIASEDNTRIVIGNQPPIVRNRGEYYEFLLNNNQPSRIFADKPIMVAQFSQSNRTDNNGDPFMIILSSVSQSKNDVTFVAYDSYEISDYYLNVVTLTSEKDNIFLDGEPLGFFFKPFPGTNYSYTQHRIYPGRHRLINSNPNRGFLAYVYGYGGFESYGYGVGFNLDLVLDLGQSIDFDGDTLRICETDKIVLDAGPYFDYYLWNTGDTTQKITVTKQDHYWAQGTTIDGCTQSDSLYIWIKPIEKPDIGEDTTGCAIKLQLNAGDGYERYNWNTGDTTQIIEAAQTNQYRITVYDEFGCPASDTMNLTVFPVPLISMVGEDLTCGIKARTLSINFEGADENMISNGQMEWKTEDQNITLTNKTNISTDIIVTEWGSYKVSFTFTTPDGCEVSDSYTLHFADIPSSKIEFADDPNDKCKAYSREIKYTGNATQNASYFWDFDGCLADSIDWNLRRVSLGAYNSVPFVSLVVEENGCWSDTTRLEIGANPDFTMYTEKNRGCDSATVYFSGELITPDTLKFEWDFGDGSPVNNQQNPSHFYNSVGSFDVGLVIINQINGCKVGYTIEEMVKIFPTPEVEIAVDPDFCYENPVEVFYIQNIDSSFCTWDFNGTAHITGEGNDTIIVFLDKQIATIRLQVEEYGCKSNWAETTARRKPIFNITTDLSEGCQPLPVLASAVTADEQLDYQWLTDSLSYSGKDQYFILPDAGTYDFKLAAKSLLTGCSDTLTKPDVVQVHPKPDAQFEVDYPVAIIEHATINFTNLTPLVDIFNWDFADGSTSTEENPQHTFTKINKYPVELIVESEFGCKDTGMMEIEILPFNVYTPNAFRPDSEIEENREFMPVGVGVDPNGFQLQIYNRWGEVIFESNSPEYKWDGTTKNNQPAPMGNYIWKADFADIQGFKHSMKGQIMLIR
ncbi:MAG TPA: PKD domain-containing protein [Draconibacterium sp.]|nr:PKD domain-containing protein [Draconibacterium sp.]